MWDRLLSAAAIVLGLIIPVALILIGQYMSQ
jgi:hypothetical protein